MRDETEIIIEQVTNAVQIMDAQPVVQVAANMAQIEVQAVGARGPQGTAPAPTGTLYVSAVWRFRDVGDGTMVAEHFDGANWNSSEDWA